MCKESTTRWTLDIDCGRVTGNTEVIGQDGLPMTLSGSLILVHYVVDEISLRQMSPKPVSGQCDKRGIC